jgi:hypothetical protein
VLRDAVEVVGLLGTGEESSRELERTKGMRERTVCERPSISLNQGEDVECE